MSSSIRLRRSPKPGALTATAWNVPRSLLTTIVASDSPSTSSATISSGRPAGPLDAALERHRVGTGRDVLEAFAHDRLGENGRGGRTVTGDVVRRRRHLAHELRALVLEDVLDLDLAGDRDTVVRDRRGAVSLVEHDVAPLRAKGDPDRVGDDVDPPLERATGVLVELQFLVRHSFIPSWCC